TTHNGMIAVPIPERVNATLMVRTYNGSFRSTFPVKQDDQNPRKRLTLTLGNGSAHIELESFGGTIALRRPGEPRPAVERKRKDKDKDQAFVYDRNAIADAIAEAQAGIPDAIAEAVASVPEAIEEALASVEHEFAFAMPNPMPMPMPRPMPNPVPRIRR